eukprot:CAMPEP_0183375646 /NCGR_PEP_ID=MMETSP0164_2-20130417/117991_1 /TAXON_ID=221442 /ORGANISM="Coccolithus pelagicus ssp braarudi, Strain PLY182g" /LENGTH=176 /DNA_ID=CAMNT_0025552835 /DNA_START=27 /DNA_END=554 /DNA_ORIENTATION=+
MPPPTASTAPPRPPGIPAHYLFDEEVELWMPPSAISKAAAVAPTSTALTTADSGITVYKSGPGQAATPYQANSSDPICFEYTNTGTCSRLARGEICRYRHLEATHPDVIADKVRQGKLPPSALAAAQAGSLNKEALQALSSVASSVLTTNSPAGAESDLPDPGPGASLCFDFVNNG